MVKKLTTLLAVAVMAGLAKQTQVFESRFNGTVDTAWTNAANWATSPATSNFVPTATDVARLQNAKTANIDSVEVIGGLNFRGDQNLGQSIINVNNGGSLTSDGSQFSGVVGGFGLLMTIAGKRILKKET